MKLTQIYILAITVFLASKTHNVFAQTSSKCKQEADSLFFAKSYQSAYALYHRIWFFASENEKSTITNNYLLSAFYAQHYNTSLEIIQFLKSGAKPNLGSDQKLIEIVAYFNAENYEDCTKQIENYMDDSINNFQANLAYFKLLCEIKLNRKDLVRQSALHLKKFATAKQQLSLDSLLNRYENMRYFSPQKAQILSLLLPGLGQLYQKDYHNAGNAFFVNGSLIGATIITAHFYNWPQAALFWIFYVPHYYLGNGRSSRDLALQKNEKIKENVYAQFKNWSPN